MLVFSHGNKVGTGSQLIVDVIQGDWSSRDVTISIYPQINKKEVDKKWEGSQFSPHGLGVCLKANEVAHLIRIFQGSKDEVMISKGLRQANEEGVSTLYIDYVTSPFVGYAVHISSAYEDRPKEDMRIVLNPTEGLAIQKSLEAAMAKIAFDI